MVWADGKIQPGELIILKGWIHRYVEHINHIAGYKAIHLSDTMKFAQRFLKSQPEPGLLLLKKYGTITNKKGLV